MGILERNLCVVKSAFHVLPVLQIDVIILKELSFLVLTLQLTF